MSMELKTISDEFRAQIGEHERVVAAVFTTYRFEPDFFEQEIIPLMLDQSLEFSSDQRIKSIQVRETLSESGLPLEVFYDLDLFRQQGTVSPAMEYLHHGIRGERSAFHAKLILLLVEDAETNEQTLCVGAGSANLTIAGWWENVECQHWEWVSSGDVSLRFLNQLREDVAWLAARRKCAIDSSNHGLPRISTFLDKCKASHGAATISWWGLSSLAEQKPSSKTVRKPSAFVKFLRDEKNKQSPNFKNWDLEIISPYFAESPDFDEHKFFFTHLSVGSIRLYLPINDQDEALCRQDYYERIANTDGVEWATWAPGMRKGLGLQGTVNRTTHAKIYHFYNGKQSWVFIGSVNFTYRAMNDNQEAGFFTQLPVQTTLLEPLKSAPEKWCPEDELPGVEVDKDRLAQPDLILEYDWKLRTLSVALDGDKSGPALEVNILSPEGEIVVANVPVKKDCNPVECEPEAIEALLKTSGFMHISGKRISDSEAFPDFMVMVQQTNWTHKPLNLPNLSPQEIMQIYAGLSQNRRNQIIELLKLRQLREMGLLGESAGSAEHEDRGRQFFAEYAELFHAFRNLRKRLNQALGEGRMEVVDYYLSGRGMDSLPTLLESLLDEASKLDRVTVYLALLCLLQIYDQPEYETRYRVKEYRTQCWDKLMELEASGELTLINEDGDPARGARFFAWYREQFLREYRHKDGEDADETT